MASPTTDRSRQKSRLRTASLYCLGAWAAVWVMWLLFRFSAVDIRLIPGIGPVLLLSMVVAVLAPLAAIALAGIALFQEPLKSQNWLALGCAGSAFFGQALVFVGSGYL